MSYLTALGCVLAIIAIIIIGGVIIAYLGKVIIGIFDADKTLDRKSNSEEQEIINIRDNVYNNTYNNSSEKKTVETKTTKAFDEDYNYTQEVDVDAAKREREALEKEIKESKPATEQKVDVDASDDFFADYKKTLSNKDEDLDDLDLMSMIDEVSNDVIEDKKVEVRQKEETESKANSSMLNKYSIDDILADVDDDEEDEEDEEVEVKSNSVADENLEEMRSIKADIMNMLDEIKNGKSKQEEIDQEERISAEVAKRVDEKLSESLQVIEELKRALEEKESEVESAKNEQQALEEKYNQINKEMVEQLQNQNREIEDSIQSTMNESFDQIHELKLQLAELTKQLQEERSMNWKVVETAQPEPEKPVEVTKSEIVEEVVSNDVLDDIHEENIVNEVEERLEETTIEVSELVKKVEEITNKQIIEQEAVQEVVTMQYSTEQQYLKRIEVLEERLKVARKDLKLNDKEYKPLEKVKRTLDRDKAKLRRKEAIAAKKKVALYGVNNYVDIDKEKAEKLAHELELLDGLRLSVSHCEEVMNNNKERYPILEHTHIILTNNIKDLEADLEQLNKELQLLRDKDED